MLINGATDSATGVSGKIAVQMAKLLGAGKVVGAGRDDASLQTVLKLGANAVIDTRESDDEVKEAFLGSRQKLRCCPRLFVGTSAELLLQALVPKQAGFVTHKTRLVHIGEAAGLTITLPAEALRTSGVRLTGAGYVPGEAWDRKTEGDKDSVSALDEDVE